MQARRRFGPGQGPGGMQEPGGCETAGFGRSRVALEDSYVVTGQEQLMGGGEAIDAGAHDGDLHSVRFEKKGGDRGV